MYNKFIEIGDKVKIRSKKWYDEFNDLGGNIGQFVPEMSLYCNKVAQVVNIINDYDYELDIDNGFWDWQDYMFDLSSIFLNFKKKVCNSCENKKLCCDFCSFKKSSFSGFNIGDKVIIKPKDWYVNNEIDNDIQISYCSSIATITDISCSRSENYYRLDISNKIWWPDYMFDLRSYCKSLLNIYCSDCCIYSNGCDECLLNKYK